MLRTVLIAAAAAGLAAPAVAGPAERLGWIDKRLDRAERQGAWAQGGWADRAEDRFDRFEDRVDRREDRRDRAIDLGPLDRLEDRVDRAENRWDRRENHNDRRRGW